jgi:hypothetical protein
MHARRWSLGVIAASASALFVTVPAPASQVTPGPFSGPVAGGGAINFVVADDGGSIRVINVVLPDSGCGLLIVNDNFTVPITNGAFTAPAMSLTVNGSFPTPSTAQGTLQATGACATSVRNWTAQSGTQPTPTPTPPTTTPPPPVIALSAASPQRAGAAIAVTVTSNEAGSAEATGTLVVRPNRHNAKRFALRLAVAQLTAATPARLKLGVPGRARNAMRKALRHHQRVKAKVRVVVHDAAGNSAQATRTVRLRRA